MRLVAASSPHVKNGDDIKITMGDVLVVMIPLLVIAFIYYGARPLVLTAVSIVSCVVFEYLYRRFFGRSRSIGDLSAAVTGMMIALNLPAAAPVWMPVAGAFFAIVIVKQLFGGIGKNIFNPAAAAIAFLTVTWPGIMSSYPLPFNPLPAFATPHGFETGRTTLASLKSYRVPDNTLLEMFFGNRPGTLGASCIVIILIAGLYLLYRRIISWQTPVAFVGVVALAAVLFPRCPSGAADSAVYEIMSGSLIFVALLMATDPVTSPVTGLGRLVYGACCGILTVVIRYFGIYPEGAFFAVLMMNPFVFACDRFAWKLKVMGGRTLYAKE